MVEALPDKKCRRCGEIKPLSDFYKQRYGRDGHANICGACCCAAARRRRADDVEYHRARDRVRGKTDARRIAQRSIRSATPEYRAKYAEYSRAYERDPLRSKAGQSVRDAVKAGTMQKLPCWVCCCEDVEGHHPDYDSPLDVIWLCPSHHAEIHSDYDTETDLLILEAGRKTRNI